MLGYDGSSDDGSSDSMVVAASYDDDGSDDDDYFQSSMTTTIFRAVGDGGSCDDMSTGNACPSEEGRAFESTIHLGIKLYPLEYSYEYS